MNACAQPENFLLSEKGPNAVLKATDFGLSSFFQVSARTRACTHTHAHSNGRAIRVRAMLISRVAPTLNLGLGLLVH